ncbi:hypothetical protein INT45_007046 [Circinella minor]|uniref:Uncharacterized protein n=1 Tax=Circinella minor TaxID=1195481 RepID=A0A8H7VNT5_9FUNG|nr:hypothetical protein INT45_007046 [Circinella minor]
MLSKPRSILHLRITQSTVVRVIVNVHQNKIDWYNENELHSLILKALQPIILEHLVNGKNTGEKRKKDLEVAPKFRLAYKFISKDHTHESMLLRGHSNYRAIRVYPYHLSIFVDEPRADFSSWFATTTTTTTTTTTDATST